MDGLAGDSNSVQEIDIPLKPSGGTFTVPVEINGVITLDFTVDSGAFAVTLPKDVLGTLLRTGTIVANDFTGTQPYVVADGRTVMARTFRIRSLTVGIKTLQNVDAVEAPMEGSLLLGQSFLARFSSWSIDNSRRALVLRDRLAPQPLRLSLPSPPLGLSARDEGSPAHVQLASQPTESAAQATAKALQRRFSSVLGGVELSVVRADMGDRGVYYRVIAPASSLSAAQELCSSLEAAGGLCVAAIDQSIMRHQSEADGLTVAARNDDDRSLRRTERILTIREAAPLEATLLKNGFTEDMIHAITATMHNVYPSTDLPKGASLRILFGPSRDTDALIPYRMSIYIADKHAATVALNDNGQYVLGREPESRDSDLKIGSGNKKGGRIQRPVADRESL
jgi:hypothetical protein